MSLLFIGGFITACIPAVFLGVNNGATLLGALVMGYAGFKIVTAKA